MAGYARRRSWSCNTKIPAFVCFLLTQISTMGMTHTMKHFLTLSKFLLVVFLPLITGLGAGCGTITGNLAASLSAAIGQNNDLETIRQGGPAYLIMVDAFVMDDPTNPALLTSAANLYSTYSDVFVEDTDRAIRLTDRALGYGLRAVCEKNKDLCGLDMMDFQTFDRTLKDADLSDVSELYTLGASWAGWIKARSDSIKALAQIPMVKGIMERVVELDEKHQNGAAHLYLGTLAMILPQILGGEPDVARLHFEKGVLLAGTKNSMARVLYAKNYARPMFDRDLHDRLLNEVLSRPVEPGDDSLVNTLARNEAAILLETGDDYFQ